MLWVSLVGWSFIFKKKFQLPHCLFFSRTHKHFLFYFFLLVVFVFFIIAPLNSFFLFLLILFVFYFFSFSLLLFLSFVLFFFFFFLLTSFPLFFVVVVFLFFFPWRPFFFSLWSSSSFFPCYFFLYFGSFGFKQNHNATCRHVWNNKTCYKNATKFGNFSSEFLIFLIFCNFVWYVFKFYFFSPCFCPFLQFFLIIMSFILVFFSPLVFFFQFLQVVCFFKHIFVLF